MTGNRRRKGTTGAGPEGQEGNGARRSGRDCTDAHRRHARFGCPCWTTAVSVRRRELVLVGFALYPFAPALRVYCQFIILRSSAGWDTLPFRNAPQEERIKYAFKKTGSGNGRRSSGLVCNKIPFHGPRFCRRPVAAPQGAPKLGGTPTAFSLRMRAGRGGGQPFDIVEHCRKIGMGGVQTNPPSTDPAEIKKFRQRIEALQHAPHLRPETAEAGKRRRRF